MREQTATPQSNDRELLKDAENACKEAGLAIEQCLPLLDPAHVDYFRSLTVVHASAARLLRKISQERLAKNRYV
jgi:hypothetical protein